MNSYKPPYTISSKILTLCSKISELLVTLEYQEKDIITPKLRKKNRIKTLVGTLEIEGNFLGEEKITALVDGKRVLGTTVELLEVEGAINAYKELENYRFDSQGDLLQAHKILMDGILKEAGNFRMVNVRVGNHIAPPPYMVSKHMGELFDWLKDSDEHPLVKSCVFHYEFEFIHPFSDGNGRIGRLWQSVILYHWKNIFSSLPIESIIRDNQQKYYDVLESSGVDGDSRSFIEFMLEVILQTIENVPKIDPNNVPKTRLEQIVDIVEQNQDITIKELASKFELNEKTIKRDIEKLKDNNTIVRIGSSRKGYWELITNNKEN